MDILSYGNFHTSLYEDISWNKIFYDASCALSENAEPLGLVNSDFNILITSHFLNHDSITLCGYSEKINIKNKADIDHVQFTWIFPDMILLQWYFVTKPVLLEQTMQSTQALLLRILFESIRCCERIFYYTFEHLAHRKYDETILTDISIIQHDFSEISIHFQAIQATEKKTISDIVYCFAMLIDILAKLSQLGGARSVLENRAIDFLCHLKIFRKFIELGLTH